MNVPCIVSQTNLIYQEYHESLQGATIDALVSTAAQSIPNTIQITTFLE